jgi:calcineurin-like phosphoesterase family protein
MIYVTADTHYGHTNIITHCHRPFRTVAEMGETITKNWNNIIQPTDTVYHLGDFAFRLPDTLPVLNGQKFLVIGNHDKKLLPKYKNIFGWMRDIYDLKTETQRFWLSHYAHRVWNHSHHGSIHLYGHSHNTLPDDPNSLSMDVGMDAAYAILGEFRPFSLDEVLDIIKRTKVFKPIDHHRGLNGNQERTDRQIR